MAYSLLSTDNGNKEEPSLILNYCNNLVAKRCAQDNFKVDIFDCPKCNKVILKEDEIGDSTKENSICCDTCGTWWHLPRADLTMSTADALDSWVCQSCLADVVNAIDSDDVLEFNFAQ